ncbi:MAG: hypothetical protein WDM77_14935 [Steroidobacteraceae bacterium]
MRLSGGPGKVALYEYDNRAFVVESFNDEAVTVQVSVGAAVATLRNLGSGALLQKLPPAPQSPAESLRAVETLRTPEGLASHFVIRVAAHSYAAFSLESAQH